MDSPIHYYAFEMLYWCGLRIGELFALTPDDFNFDTGTVTIGKSYQRIKGEDVITCPKTKKSNRVIQMPQFLTDEIQDYIKQLYGVEHDSRLFPLGVKYTDGSMISIYCPAVEDEVAENMHQRSELDRLIYNDPVAYAELILNGAPETYLKSVTEYKPLDS